MDHSIKIFSQFNNIESYFTTKPIVGAELLDELISELPDGEHLVKAQLVHGNRVQIVDEPYLHSQSELPDVSKANVRPGFIEVSDTDALCTNLKNVALTTTHGDCLAIFYYDPIHEAIGLAHAGWKGTMLGIAKETVLSMEKAYGTKASELFVYISPGIDKCCFEVKEDVKKQFKEELPFSVDFISIKDAEHYLIYLKGINKKLLSDLGVKNIEVAGDCTCCREDLYWSYRRCGDKNRMRAYIKITGK